MTAPLPPPPPPSAPPSVPTLHDAIWERYSRLLDIKKRLFVMREFVDETERVSRGKTFQIRNDIVWNMMLDYRDKCVIDLYSLTVEMRHGIRPADGSYVSRKFMSKTGLFKTIRDRYLASFSRVYAPQPDDDEYEIALYTKRNAEKFPLLFPTATTDMPAASDIEALCERFRLHMRPLGTDRNKNRAHAYEGEAGTTKMHSVDELEKFFKFVETVLKQLALLGTGSDYGGHDMNVASTTRTVQDIADLILLGHQKDIAELLAMRTRDELFDRLHAIDDAKAGSDDRYFNERRFDDEFGA